MLISLCTKFLKKILEVVFEEEKIKNLQNLLLKKHTSAPQKVSHQNLICTLVLDNCYC